MENLNNKGNQFYEDLQSLYINKKTIIAWRDQIIADHANKTYVDGAINIVNELNKILEDINKLIKIYEKNIKELPNDLNEKKEQNFDLTYMYNEFYGTNNEFRTYDLSDMEIKKLNLLDDSSILFVQKGNINRKIIQIKHAILKGLYPNDTMQIVDIMKKMSNKINKLYKYFEKELGSMPFLKDFEFEYVDDEDAFEIDNNKHK